MSAGGITDRRTFNAAFALGAEGVFCGTLFLAAKEARTAPNIKEMMLKANTADIEQFLIIIDLFLLHSHKNLFKWIRI